MTPHFDPRHQGWLPALTVPRRPPQMMGLIEVFRRAPEIVALAGSSPGETIALVEYLLASIYASGHVPATADRWRESLAAREPLTTVADWLAAQPDDDWDLFHPDRPLAQNSLLAPFMKDGGVGPAQIAIGKAGNYNQHFNHEHLHYPVPVPAGEAFRHLLTQMAYSQGGNAAVKPGWLGYGLFSQSQARLCSRIRVLATGDNLCETLRLNLVPTPRTRLGTFNQSWTDNRYRQRRVFTGPKTDRNADGPADVHSFLCRSILLHPVITAEGSVAVSKVLMGSGEVGKSGPEFEDDAIFVKDKAELKIFQARDERDLWQQSYALYASVAEQRKGNDLYTRLSTLRGRQIRLLTVGLVTKQAKLVSWVSDSFPFMAGREAALFEAARTGSDICESAETALYRAAREASFVLHPDADPKEQRPRLIATLNGALEMWGRAAEPFHQLLEEVADRGEPDAAMRTFAAIIAEVTHESLNARLQPLPPSGRARQARVMAQHTLRRTLSGSKSPYYLKKAADERA